MQNRTDASPRPTAETGCRPWRAPDHQETDTLAGPRHRPWCWPSCKAEASPGFHAHERVLSIARLNYGPIVAISLGNETRQATQPDDVLMQIRSEDDHNELVALDPEEARMLARYLTDAADQWDLHRARACLTGDAS